MAFGFEPYHPRIESDPALLELARQGYLTRANTYPGTPERAAVYQVTRERQREAAMAYGISPRVALGHARPGEVTMREIRQAQANPSEARIEVQQHYAFHRMNELLQRYVRYSPQTVWGNMQRIQDPQLLAEIQNVQDAEQARQLASNQSPREYGGINPYWYHAGKK